jgi:hypothetical protein
MKNSGIIDSLKEAIGLKQVRGKKVTESDAKKLAESFHGRESRGKIEIAERSKYRKNLAILGELEELGIQVPGKDRIKPIRFSTNIGNSRSDLDICVYVCAATESQIEFIDGDQTLEFDTAVCRELQIDESDLEKDFVRVGEVASIVYFADKHHLEGPKYQKQGTSYEHMFGEEGGKLPELWYDTLNDSLLLLGGSYSITPEGIKN